MPSEPIIFPMGRVALDWVLEGGKPQRGGMGARLTYRWQQFWFEQNLRTLNARCAPEPPLNPPVFILGMWRSGTTFLHELLATNKTLLAPNTWQCMNSSMHLLNAPPVGKTFTRPMDGFSVSAESPQEDEFAMLAQGIPSVYRAFFDPRRFPELERWLQPEAWLELRAQDWWPRWRSFLASVQKGHDQRLLLKSPNHSFRATAILREMPQASLVWVLRDPREVFFSNVKMWKAMIERYALWTLEEAALNSQLNHFLVSALRLSSQTLLDVAAKVPRTQLAVVRYEDVVDHPADIVKNISERLRLPWQSVDSEALAKVVSEASSLPRASYRDRAIPAELQAILPQLAESYAAAVESHGVRGMQTNP